MLKLDDLVNICRDVAHFCSEQVSVFRATFNRVGGQLLESATSSPAQAVPITASPHLRL